jgi:mycofactocin system glycosyltransferase
LAACGDEVGRVVVVDDGSQPPIVVERLTERPFDEEPSPARLAVEVVRLEANVGPGAARNRGLALLEGQLALLLDAGVGIEPGAIPRLVALRAATGAGAVAPRVRSPRPRDLEPDEYQSGPARAWFAYERDSSPLDQGATPAKVRRGGPVGYVPSTALLVDRSKVAELGGFDEDLRYGEDVDLVWRMEGSGSPVWYAAEVEVDHPPRRDLRAAAVQRFRYGRSAASLAARHRGAAAPAVVSLWSLGGWALALRRPLAGVLALFGMSAAVAARLPEFPGAPAERLAVGLRLGLSGNLAAGWGLAKASVRPWFPLLGLAGLSRRGRWAWALLVGVPTVEYLRERRYRDPDAPVSAPRWIALRLGDHLAYSAGVWAGAIGERRADVLVPQVVELKRGK